MIVGTAQEHSCTDKVLYKAFWNFDNLLPDVLSIDTDTYIDTDKKCWERGLEFVASKFVARRNL